MPVLLSPQYDVIEAEVPGQEQAARKLAESQAQARQAAFLFDAGK